MKICRHLAMTRWEMENFALPKGFSPAVLLWERELTDLPTAILTVIPDPENRPLLFRCLTEANPTALLLDFQKPGQEELVKKLEAALPCPVAVSELYAHQTQGPVFLSPCPPDKALEAHLAPWKGREIWLDVAPEVLELRITPTGCEAVSLSEPPKEASFTDEKLCCRYRFKIYPNEIRFTLWRDKQMLEAHIRQAESLSVTKVIGLFQEWNTLK